MVSNLECVFKGIKEIKAGSFKNENGDIINYNQSYRIRFDQIISGLPKETEIKITKELALNLAKNLQIYDKIVITFNVIIYNSNSIRIFVTNVKKI